MKISLSENNLLVGFVLAATIVPFLCVHFIPATDLPQHLSQIRLFWETLNGAHGNDLVVNWFSPNILVYLFIAILWKLFPPVAAGKVAMMLIAVAWVLSVFQLARKRGRSFSAAALASIFVFNRSLYWGFATFLVGWPFFVLWLCLLPSSESERASGWALLKLTGCAIALFLCHALWFAAGIAVLAIMNFRRRVRFRTWAMHSLAIAPVALYALYWFSRLARMRAVQGFDTAAHWGTMPWERFYPQAFADGFLGGLWGFGETLVLLAAGVWVIASLLRRNGDDKIGIDKELLIVSSLFFIFGFLAPEKYMNTIFFASRWLPVAATLLVLSLPLPAFKPGVRFAFPLFVVVTLSLVTTWQWIRFNDRDLSGLDESLSVIPANSRVLGLDFVKESELIKGRPYLQTFAYAQVLRGGELNFSFSQHESGIIVDTKQYRPAYTQGLEWNAENVKPQDFRQFDIALINATDADHAIFGTFSFLKPLNQEGRWRAYECLTDSAIPH